MERIARRGANAAAGGHGKEQEQKQRLDLGLVANPFVKARNLGWDLDLDMSFGLDSEASPPSPPAKRRKREGEGSSSGFSRSRDQAEKEDDEDEPQPPSAAVEAGHARVPADPAAYFGALLARHVVVPSTSPQAGHPLPLLPIETYKALYAAHADNPRGAHFVVHQHDHPVAGPHYDLRLQINECSSVSWAVMYGLPGDPNSGLRSWGVGGGENRAKRGPKERGKRGPPKERGKASRNATETRVHALWSHLVETGSVQTGSMLIWDTGTYSVLSSEDEGGPETETEAETSGEEEEDTDIDGSSGEEEDGGRRRSDEGGSRRRRRRRRRRNDDEGGGNKEKEKKTEQQKLASAFAARRVRVRLDGFRLPRPYVVCLRLTRANDAEARGRAARAAGLEGRGKLKMRRRGARGKGKGKEVEVVQTSSSSDFDSDPSPEHGDRDRTHDHENQKKRKEEEDLQTRLTNAYPGSLNSVDSVYQRRWYLSLDRAASGFVRQGGKGLWVKREDHHNQKRDKATTTTTTRKETENENGRLRYPFYVLGPAAERSVVTGRLGAEVLRDEGVDGHVSRGGWRAVLG